MNPSIPVTPGVHELDDAVGVKLRYRVPARRPPTPTPREQWLRPHPWRDEYRGEYFVWDPSLSIEELLERWVEHGAKAYDDSSASLELPTGEWFQAIYSAEELWPYRRDDRPVSEALVEGLREHGWLSPVLLKIGRNGCVELGEGNHRVAVGHRLGLSYVPVRLWFVQEAACVSPEERRERALSYARTRAGETRAAAIPEHVAYYLDRPMKFNPSAGSKVERIFDEAFDEIEEQFGDFGDIELHEDEKAGSDNGAGAERQFAYCKDGRPIVIAFAPKAEALPLNRLRGLMRHEFGHALEYRYGVRELEERLDVDLPHGVERRADVIAEAVWGEPVEYDERLIQCVACNGRLRRPRHLPEERATLRANPATEEGALVVEEKGPELWVFWQSDAVVSDPEFMYSPPVGGFLHARRRDGQLVVQYLEVTSALRRTGVGTALYEAALEHAIDHGLRLASDTRREWEADHFWQKMRQAGLADRVFESGRDYYVMKPEAKPPLPNPGPEERATLRANPDYHKEAFVRAMMGEYPHEVAGPAFFKHVREALPWCEIEMHWSDRTITRIPMHLGSEWKLERRGPDLWLDRARRLLGKTPVRMKASCGELGRERTLWEWPATLRANASRAGYSFDRSCPAGPVWWIEWVTDPDVAGYDDEVSWQALEDDLAGDEVFEAFMEEWDPHPEDDAHVSYYRTRSPTGVPLIVIQHSGIEHIWAKGGLDLDAEEREAEEAGFWYLSNNPQPNPSAGSVLISIDRELTLEFGGTSGIVARFDESIPLYRAIDGTELVLAFDKDRFEGGMFATPAERRWGASWAAGSAEEVAQWATGWAERGRLGGDLFVVVADGEGHMFYREGAREHGVAFDPNGPSVQEVEMPIDLCGTGLGCSVTVHFDDVSVLRVLDDGTLDPMTSRELDRYVREHPIPDVNLRNLGFGTEWYAGTILGESVLVGQDQEDRLWSVQDRESRPFVLGARSKTAAIREAKRLIDAGRMGEVSRLNKVPRGFEVVEVGDRFRAKRYPRFEGEVSKLGASYAVLQGRGFQDQYDHPVYVKASELMRQYEVI